MGSCREIGKIALQKTFGESRLSHVELETIFIECEAILNSRPLSPLRDDDPDVLALTPQMLLSGFRTSMFPLHQHHSSIASQLQPNENPVKRFRYMQTLVKDFWNRWTANIYLLCKNEQRVHVKPSILKLAMWY